MLKDNLKALRESKGLTKKQVAQGVGINERAYIAYEYGERDVSTETLSKLADFYGVSTDYLLGRTTVKQMATEQPDPFQLLGFQKTVDDDEFTRLYNTLPDYVKQVFVDTMAKLAQATASNLKKQSTHPPQPVEPPQAPESTIVQSTSQNPSQSVVNEPPLKPDIQISQTRNSEFAIARGGNGMYKPVPTDEQIASFTPVPEDSGL